MTSRRMPKQKPGRSEQTVGTPRAFLNAVEDRFGVIDWDLAATAANAVTGKFLGPGAPRGEDSLAVDWAMLPAPPRPVFWLNPPYSNIKPFARKCAEQAPAIPGEIVMLVPASISTEWFAQYVHRRALVLAIRPRLTFVGQSDPYPKDLMLVVYGRWIAPGFETWRWDGAEENPF
jgi:phage N-6-adenine-methyltransferase